jgi:hypothetical protein
MKNVHVALFGLVCSLSIGCTVTAYSVAPVSEVPEVSEMLKHADYRGSGFVQMNSVPYPSDLAKGSMVTCYVSKEAALSYAGVVPDLDGAVTGGFPVGGVIVREVADQTGKMQKLTVMVKREQGYFPEVGDFFFGVSDGEGVPMPDASGQMQWGKLTTCAGCHQGRAKANFLFGVSEDDRLRH